MDLSHSYHTGLRTGNLQSETKNSRDLTGWDTRPSSPSNPLDQAISELINAPKYLGHPFQEVNEPLSPSRVQQIANQLALIKKLIASGMETKASDISQIFQAILNSFFKKGGNYTINSIEMISSRIGLLLMSRDLFESFLDLESYKLFGAQISKLIKNITDSLSKEEFKDINPTNTPLLLLERLYRLMPGNTKIFKLLTQTYRKCGCDSTASTIEKFSKLSNDTSKSVDERRLAAQIVEVLTYQEGLRRKGSTPLTTAISKGWLQISAQLIKAKLNLDTPVAKGYTPLQLAIYKGQKEIALQLIEANVNFETPCPNGLAPLHSAIKQGQEDVALRLIEKGASLNANAPNGSTPLASAISFGRTRVIEKLAKDKELLEKKSNGATPLIIAISKGRVDIVKLLIEAKVDLETPDACDFTPLQAAIYSGQKDIALQLIEANVNFETPCPNGLTPLHSAIKQGQEDVALRLIEKGASLNANAPNGSTPLASAISFGRTRVIEKLAKDKELLEKKSNGATPLIIAISKGRVDIVKLLIEAKVDLETPDACDFTPLQAAIYSGQKEIALQLIEANVNFETPCPNGLTPLHSAIKKGQEDVALRLIEKGASLNANAPSGSTPLASAINFGRTRVIEKLAKDKDLLEKKSNGATALIIAISKGRVDIVKLLIEAKVNLETPSPGGATPLLLAIFNGQQEIAVQLIKAKAKLETASALGETPLQLSISKEQTDVALALLDAELDLTKGAASDTSFLYESILKGMEPVSLRLIEKGGSLESVPLKGYSSCADTSLNLAIRSRQNSVVKAIKEAQGEDPNILEADEFVPVDVEAHALRVLVKYLKAKYEDLVLELDLPSEHGSYLVRLQSIRRLKAAQQESLFELQIYRVRGQPSDPHALTESKLFIQVTPDGLIDGVYKNGEKVSCSEFAHVHNTDRKALVECLKTFMEGHAIDEEEFEDEYDEEGEDKLLVHPSAIQLVPEKVLGRLNPDQSYKLFDDEMELQDGVDVKAVKLQVLSDLASRLFSGSPDNTLKIESGMLTLDTSSLAQRLLLISVVSKLFITALNDSQIVLGRLLNDEFWDLVSLYIAKQEVPSVDDKMKAFRTFFTKDSTQDLLVKAYFNGATSPSESLKEKLEVLGYSNKETSFASKADFQKFIIAETLENPSCQRVLNAADQVGSQLKDVKNISKFDLSRTIQGEPFNRENIIRLIKCESEHPVVREKFEWLKEYIREAPKEEVLQFCKTVTGSPLLSAQSQIKVLKADNEDIFICQVQACFDQLIVPIVHTDVGTNVQEGVTVSNKDKFINNLRLLYLEKGFDME